MYPSHRNDMVMNRRRLLGLGVSAVALARVAQGGGPGPAAGGPSVIVLDDMDPDFRGAEPRGDGVRAFSAEGKELWSLKTLNNCEAVGANHGIALDRKRGR